MKARMRNVSRPGFTIIEVMLSIFIFAMVLTAIYSTWIGILRGTKVGLAAAAEVQRSRIAARTVEEALMTAQMFNENMRYYSFDVKNEGDFAQISMVSRLPGSFLGVGRYGAGDLVVRRITFSVEGSPDGKNELVMRQAPILMETNRGTADAYKLILAKDVTQFSFEFWDLQKRDWVEDWIYTNQLPRLVRMTLGLGQTRNRSEPHDLVSRIVALPSQSVFGVQGAQRPMQP
jgi:prepilin-type N-terminal cleavage/methylation domain-containing protein